MLSPNGDMLARSGLASLADTKAAEDFPKQIIAGELAGDFTQRKLRAPQFLCEKLEGASRAQRFRGLYHTGLGATQCVEMTAPRR